MFNPSRIPKIIDFGLAAPVTGESAFQTQDTRSPSMRQGGVPRWLSQNRLGDGGVKFSDDIYAFGCIVLFVSPSHM